MSDAAWVEHKSVYRALKLAENARKPVVPRAPLPVKPPAHFTMKSDPPGKTYRQAGWPEGWQAGSSSEI